MVGAYSIFLLLALFAWVIGVVWLIGGLKFAASLASSEKAVETANLVRIVALRSFGMFLAGVQFILLYSSLGSGPVTFWPLIIGLLLLIGSRVYVFA